MAGLLDSKTRMIDAVITQEGKRQLVSGDFNIKFASFSDAASFYENDALSGSSDASQRVYFEANSLPHDAIVFEADDAGLLRTSLHFADDVGVMNGKVVRSSNSYLEFVTGSDFVASGTKIIESALDNLQKNRFIGTQKPFDDAEKFTLSTNEISFALTNDKPINHVGIKKLALNALPDLFSDRRLSHLQNFRYLPPVNKKLIDTASPKLVGHYPPLGDTRPLSIDEIDAEISALDDMGMVVDVEFVETSRANNVVMQFFDIRQTEILKLDVIDYGLVHGSDGNTRRIFFLGRLFVNDLGVHTFVNLFTVVLFDKQE